MEAGSLLVITVTPSLSPEVFRVHSHKGAGAGDLLCN